MEVPINDNRAHVPQVARDGRSMADWPAHERAYEQSIIDLNTAGKATGSDKRVSRQQPSTTNQE